MTGVTTKILDVLLNPSQSCNHVRDCVVAMVYAIVEGQKTEVAQPVVDGNDDNVASGGQVGPVGVGIVCRSSKKSPAVKVQHDGLEALRDMRAARGAWW